MNLWKGYILSKGKEPLKSVFEGDFLQEPPEHDDYVGVLKDEFIQVDFDDEQSAKTALDIVNKKRLRCDILKTTRGVHLYFKNDPLKVNVQKVEVFNGIGLSCDIGLGMKNRVVPLRMTKELEIIKNINGEEIKTTQYKQVDREWLQTYDDLDVIPSYFRPVSKKDYELAKTSTRNQTLYTYILVLQMNGFSKEEVRETLKVINEFVLYEALSERELDMITRDESFSDELFFEKNRFLHDRFGNYMLANSHIIMVDHAINIYTDDGVYSPDVYEFEKAMLKKIQFLKDNQRKEVYKYLELKCDKKGQYAPEKYIALKDEILDIETMRTFPYSPSFVITNKIEYEYSPNTYSEVMDKTLNKISRNDPSVRSLLEEMIGYCLFRKNLMQVCFILTGEGANGKSTFLNLIKKLLGKKNYSSLDMKELQDTFKPAELYGKLANIGDDISAEYFEESSVFKKAVTGESFLVQRKYAHPFELENYAKLIFCANELPMVKDKSDGFLRRIVIIPFKAKFKKTDSDYDPFIESKLMTEESIQYLLKLGIEGLKRLLYNRSFTICKAGEDEKEDFVKSNNNVMEWLDEALDIENNSVADVYLQYRVWCSNNACMPLKKINFSKELRQLTGLTSKVVSIDGKATRIYIKEDDNEDL